MYVSVKLSIQNFMHPFRRLLTEYFHHLKKMLLVEFYTWTNNITVVCKNMFVVNLPKMGVK